MAEKSKILIAEDDRAIAKALNLKLSHEGFETIVVSDGTSAIDILEKQKFSLVILDLMMPEVDGFEVLEKIKNKKINVPVIVVSNLSQDEDISRAKELGAVCFFVKSETPIAEVVDKIKQYLKV
jgi:two-component system alkaline phosphatase synthesis response regulator PhoP